MILAPAVFADWKMEHLYGKTSRINHIKVIDETTGWILILGGIDMNKKELIAAVAEASEVSKKDAEKVIQAFTDVVADELKKGEKIQLVGFGTFEVSERAERIGRNPKSGEEMVIAASKTPKFKAGKALKDIVNE